MHCRYAQVCLFWAETLFQRIVTWCDSNNSLSMSHQRCYVTHCWSFLPPNHWVSRCIASLRSTWFPSHCLDKYKFQPLKATPKLEKVHIYSKAYVNLLWTNEILQLNMCNQIEWFECTWTNIWSCGMLWPGSGQPGGLILTELIWTIYPIDSDRLCHKPSQAPVRGKIGKVRLSITFHIVTNHSKYIVKYHIRLRNAKSTPVLLQPMFPWNWLCLSSELARHGVVCLPNQNMIYRGIAETSKMASEMKSPASHCGISCQSVCLKTVKVFFILFSTNPTTI